MTVGQIHSYESFATLDGEGIRFAVFLAGCPLRCIYCHNPDTWFGGGEQVTCEQLLRKIMRYKPYFRSNGGVTFSGGEPLLQSEFICEMATLLKENDINYVLDTSGALPLSDSVKKAIDGAENIILDLKFWDTESYKKFAYCDRQRVIDFGDYLASIGKKTWVRTVIVPNLNDNLECLDKYLNVVNGWKNVCKYELLAFHTMGFSKYEKLGFENKLVATPPLDDSVLKKLSAYVDEKFNNSKLI